MKTKQCNDDYIKIKPNNITNLVVNLKNNNCIADKLLPGYDISDITNKECCDIKSNIYCWNCCHQYNSIDCNIPLKHHNNIFYIYGHFCSNECSLRYILDNFNDKYKWELISLLNFYVNISKNTSGKYIKPAPNRVHLNTFGGNLTIDEFRNIHNVDSLNNNNINIPPIIPITHEDYNYNSNISVQENKHKFKLYRSKPLNNNMNIYNTMNLNNIMNIEKEDIINTELDKTDDLTNDDNK